MFLRIPPPLVVASAEAAGDGYVSAMIAAQVAWNAARHPRVWQVKDAIARLNLLRDDSRAAWLRFESACVLLADEDTGHAERLMADVLERLEVSVGAVSRDLATARGEMCPGIIGMDMAPRLELFPLGGRSPA